MWCIDFEYRKVNRRPECFLGERNYSRYRADLEKEYDEILDIVLRSMLTDYQRGSSEALDVVSMKKGSIETEFEKHMRLKTAEE
jgi:hypothetical protein